MKFSPAKLAANFTLLFISLQVNIHDLSAQTSSHRPANTHSQATGQINNLPALARVSSAPQISGARQTGGGSGISAFQRALAAYSADMGGMPTSAQGLGALITPPPGAKNWRGPYISTNNFRAALTDPWGNLYRYVVQGAGRQALYSISSNGPDGQPGTRDDLSVQF